MEKFSLEGKVALITGASSGIGKATAELFSKLGCSIVLSGRSKENLEITLKNCEANKIKPNQKFVTYIGDLILEENVKKLAKHVISSFSKLDILVNNAGILKNDTIENFNLGQYDEIMNINVRSVLLLTNCLVKELIKTKGSIVNVSSVAGTRSFPNVMSYCVSKAAIDQITHCMALDLAPKGVRVNSVNPGVIVTEVHKRGGMSDDQYSKFLEHSKETHALGRPGDVTEVAQSIAFLASSAASFTTGANFPVCGGRVVMCPR